MDDRLLFRRQFLLARTEIPALKNWRSAAVSDLRLYTHPDLDVCSASDAGRTVVLIGYWFDAALPKRANLEILQDTLAGSDSLEGFIRAVKGYAGRYACIYSDETGLFLWQDALALREVYYCTHSNSVVCGSQPNLLAKFANPEIPPSSNGDLQHFYKHEYRDRRWIGEDTYFEYVKHLLPNHLLNLRTSSACRYWPQQEVARLRLEEAADKICLFLQGMMQAATQRHSVMLAVTAGKDSRTLLAASRSVKDKVHYFINDHGLTAEHPDIRIPKTMCESVGVPFHVNNVSTEIDPEFERVFLNNVFQATKDLLPMIQNVYFKQHSNKLNVLGIGEIGRTRYGKEPRRLNGHRMAYALGYPKSAYVIKECERILPELLQTARKFHINPMTLLYWEQTLGNWGAVGNSESDIAMEEFDPYASHALYELFLGVDEKYTRYQDSVLFHEIVHKMWPELLNWPINPPHTRIDKLRSILKRAGLYALLKELKYQVNYLVPSS
jgi:hypothetical protein